jgi:hypothetical protein
MDATCSLFESSESEIPTLSRLTSLGSRQGQTFFGPLVATLPTTVYLCSGEEYFGLCDPSVLLPLMKGPEARIKYLRHIAAKYNLPANTTFIRYVDTERFSNDGTANFEYASARPHARLNGEPKHYRWLRHLFLNNIEIYQTPTLCAKVCTLCFPLNSLVAKHLLALPTSSQGIIIFSHLCFPVSWPCLQGTQFLLPLN